MRHYLYLLLFLSALFSGVAQASDKAPVYIGFDGEYGLLNSTSAQSIELGMRLAIDEVNAAGGVLDGRPLELLTRDNRSVPARGVANLQAFAEIPDLVAVFGGRFSPVILQQIESAHQLGMPLLDAWGSATGITQHDHRPSYTFRLSLYDRIGMPFMIQHALDQGSKRPALMLPNTGWGRSNHNEAERFAEAHNMQPFPTVWYNWGEKDLIHYYRELRDAGGDTIILVANDIEGSKLVRALAELPAADWMPIVSHWGITGGNMVESSGEGIFDLDLRVIQTFSFFNARGPVAERVMRTLQQQHGMKDAAAVPSPVGLAHAYDLTHILARAIELAKSTDRAKVRDALEQVKDYSGLTGNYPQPFTAERHEALSSDQLFMARYRRDGAIVPLELPLDKPDH